MAFVKNDYNQLTLDDRTFSLTQRERSFLEKSWAVPFAEKIFPAINESDFSVLYSSWNASRPNTPVNVIMGSLILKELLGLTDDEIVESLMFDIRFQYALHTTSCKEQPLSDRSLSRFRARCIAYEAETGIDLIKNCLSGLTSELANIMGISNCHLRMDSVMIASNIKKLSRLELFYTCVANLIKDMVKNKETIPEHLMHYTNKNDYNIVIYHMRSKDTKDRLTTVLADAALLLKLCEDSYDHSSNYQLLIRLLREQTTQLEDGTLELKSSKDKSMDSTILLNPADPDATFRKKAEKEHRGYVANLVESVGDNGSLITDYAYEQNIYSDSQFLKDYLTTQDNQEDNTLVADGAYSGERNIKLASEHKTKLVTTNFTGRKPADIYADFIFSEDGKTVLKCPGGQEPLTCVYEQNNDRCRITLNKEHCNQCPYKDECKPKFFKTKAALQISWKTTNRAKQLRYMESKEFQKLSNFRNGVEALPSLLRRKYQVDKMPVRGKLKTKLMFGFKIAALNFTKLLGYLNSSVSYTQKQIFV